LVSKGKQGCEEKVIVFDSTISYMINIDSKKRKNNESNWDELIMSDATAILMLNKI
jgi:hypothetical protein